MTPPNSAAPEFASLLKEHARKLGFPLCGITAAARPNRLDAFHRWLDAGYAGTMHYLENRREAYQHPRFVLDGCRSMLMLGMPYQTDLQRMPPSSSGRYKSSTRQSRGERLRRSSLTSPPSSRMDVEPDSPDKRTQEPTGRIASYAWGSVDYHDLIHDALKQLKAWLVEKFPDASVRGVVDTAPLLEREFAELAGIGWVGKNTLLLNRRWGSYFFLACLLTDLTLAVDPPQETGHCGTCTACLEACPTDAFPQPHVLDASRCISYLTIEHRGPIDSDLRDRLDGWLFGCDVCQQVCPWNRKAELASEPAFAARPSTNPVDLLAVLDMSEEDFRQQFRRTPLWRSRRRGIIRNAILLLAPEHHPLITPKLEKLLQDSEPLVREVSAWALKQRRGNDADSLLREQLRRETDQQVRRYLEQLIS